MRLLLTWSPRQGSGSWWHNQEKGGLITSQPSHLREILVGNVVTTSHHAREVSSNYSLERKNNKIEKKGIEWARNKLHP
jgi:hypothetical protein